MMHAMRTTVTLDDDVVAGLKAAAHERDISFKEALNDAVRNGLAGPAAAREPFVMRTSAMRARPGIDLDKALRLAGELEDAEILRKLALGK